MYWSRLGLSEKFSSVSLLRVLGPFSELSAPSLSGKSLNCHCLVFSKVSIAPENAKGGGAKKGGAKPHEETPHGKQFPTPLTSVLPPPSISLSRSLRNSQNFPLLTSETAFGRSRNMVPTGRHREVLLFGTFCPHVLALPFHFLDLGMLLAVENLQTFRTSQVQEKQPKHKVFGRDLPGTSGTQTSGYPGQKLYASGLLLLF